MLLFLLGGRYTHLYLFMFSKQIAGSKPKANTMKAGVL